MSSVIELLEQIGQTANLRHATSAELVQALDGSRLDPATRGPLLAGDRVQLEALFGAAPNVCCVLEVATDGEKLLGATR